MRARLLFLALLPSLLLAEPTLQSSPAVALSFSTEKGSLHQLQVKNTDSEGRFLWKNVGPAILGTGDLWSTPSPEENTAFTPQARNGRWSGQTSLMTIALTSENGKGKRTTMEAGITSGRPTERIPSIVLSKTARST